MVLRGIGAKAEGRRPQVLVQCLLENRAGKIKRHILD